MAPNDEKDEMNQAVSEIREWLVRIDTNQQHQTELLETLNDMTKGAVEKADHAEDKADNADAKADKAIELASRVDEDFRYYTRDQSKRTRWAIGLSLTSSLTLVGIIVTIILALTL